MLIARTVFPKARITNDRFYVQKLYYDAIDDRRISLRWMARNMENEEIRRCRKDRVKYVPFRYANGDYTQTAACESQIYSQSNNVIYRNRFPLPSSCHVRIPNETNSTLKEEYDKE